MFFNLLIVDMFLNPTNSKLAQDTTEQSLFYLLKVRSRLFPWASKDEPLFYTPECGLSNELLLEKISDAFRFDYVFTKMHSNFTNIMSLRTGVLNNVSTLLKL